MDKNKEHYEEVQRNIESLSEQKKLQDDSFEWINKVSEYKYSYNFTWMGRPIIQFPQDIVAMQELIWKIKPDIIIETGIAHGGSLIFYASMLELNGKGKVIGIDVDIRAHNRKAIEEHVMYKRIKMVEGSSIDPEIVKEATKEISSSDVVMVLLDSNHTHEHVLAELEMYSKYVTKGSYLVVFDTVIEYMDEDIFPDRPWGKGNNAMTAVNEFMKTAKRFVIDDSISHKLLITVAPSGYLHCVK